MRSFSSGGTPSTWHKIHFVCVSVSDLTNRPSDPGAGAGRDVEPTAGGLDLLPRRRGSFRQQVPESVHISIT